MFKLLERLVTQCSIELVAMATVPASSENAHVFMNN